MSSSTCAFCHQPRASVHITICGKQWFVCESCRDMGKNGEYDAFQAWLRGLLYD